MTTALVRHFWIRYAVEDVVGMGVFAEYPTGLPEFSVYSSRRDEPARTRELILLQIRWGRASTCVKRVFEMLSDTKYSVVKPRALFSARAAHEIAMKHIRDDSAPTDVKVQAPAGGECRRLIHTGVQVRSCVLPSSSHSSRVCMHLSVRRATDYTS